MPTDRKLLWALATAVALAGLGWLAYHLSHPPFTEGEKLALRHQARSEWLKLAANPKPHDSSLARVLLNCFAEGDAEEELREVLATSEDRESRSGENEYYWYFSVREPRQPDEFGYVVTVSFNGSPPRLRSFYGSYTID